VKKKLLLVDDNKTICRLIEEFLGNKYDLIVQNNGLKAFEWLQAGNMPDLIISDINMPDMDGHEFVKQLKFSGLFSNIPIIMLSSVDDSKERVHFLKMGVADYIVKPFNPEELELRMDNIFK
jgi:two-component system, chemotaxis family, chemotaxis protein CheY